MLNLIDSVRGHCADIDPALVELHFRRLPAAYFERYSAAGMHVVRSTDPIETWPGIQLT